MMCYVQQFRLCRLCSYCTVLRAFFRLGSLYETIVYETQCDRVTPLVINPGRVMLTSEQLYFQPFNNIDPVPVIRVKLSQIKSLIKRRFLLRQIVGRCLVYLTCHVA